MRKVFLHTDCPLCGLPLSPSATCHNGLFVLFGSRLFVSCAFVKSLLPCERSVFFCCRRVLCLPTQWAGLGETGHGLALAFQLSLTNVNYLANRQCFFPFFPFFGCSLERQKKRESWIAEGKQHRGLPDAQ